MGLLSASEAEFYLDLAADVGKSHPVVDVHVHATEVIFGQIEYGEVPGETGTYSAQSGPYRAPRVSFLRLDDPSRAADRFDARTRNRVSRLGFTAVYQHIGRRVLLDHMQLAHVDTALLLPVAPANGGIEDQMKILEAIRGEERRLHIAYGVPASTPADAIARELRGAAAYDVRAVKLHPNISRIDLQSPQGKEWVEALLGACGQAGLPLVVHGGYSPILEDERASRHAVLQNLERIDWGRSTESVIIAHAGLFGCEWREIEGVAIPAVERILGRHSNVLVDTSGLGFEVLAAAFRRLGVERFVFGSDALYFPMWQAVVTLLHALKTTGRDLEGSYARIAGREALLRPRAST